MIMKKSFVALGVAAVLAGATGGAFAANSIAGAGTATTVAATTNTATAATDLALSESGIGNILFVPYFNAVGGNATLLNLVNTDAINGKALKVRFRGASNSDDIFDFTLFLSPGDVWAGKVSKGADGRAKLETSDNSITLPANVNQAFVTDRLPTNFTAEQKAAQTLEGYIEILNVANVPATYRPTGSTALVANPLYTAIKHVNGVAPGTTTAAGKAAIENLRNPLATQANAVDAGFDAPTGGLFANWTLIDLANASVAWSGEATAVTTVGGAGRIVFSPQLGGAVSNDLANVLTADPLLRQSATGNPITALADPAVTPQYFDFPDLSTPYTGTGALNTTSPLTQANNLSQSLAVTSISNEFLTADSISAATDWSFSIPTRRYGVAVKYAASAPLYTAVFNTLATTTSPAVIGDANTGFASAYFTSSNSKLGTGADAHKVVISTGSTSPLTAFDRSENSKQSDFVISPSTAAAVDFPGEVSVLSFNAGGTAAGSVLGAAITRKDIDVTYQDGWASIATPGLTTIGLPIVGHAFTRAVGPAVAGKSTNFGTTARHRFTR